MSVRAMAWAWSKECPTAAAKLVLLKLADHADDDGVCWPSQGRIAKDTGLTRNWVNAQIAKLAELGILIVEQRINPQGQQTNRYVLRCSPSEQGCLLSEHPPVYSVDTNHHLEPSKERIPLTSPKGETDFDRWYAVYPHKVAKAAAVKAFKTAIKLAPLDELIAAVARYVESKPPDQAFCNPATWLNQQRWLDVPAINGATSHEDSRPEPTAEEHEAGRIVALRKAGLLDLDRGRALGMARKDLRFPAGLFGDC